ncbi:MAG: hypothetical protein KF729_17770 [Sandaracinaceae bacterium]|nr:hypothetical protein [Sandaracinaceae bacterium]
MQTRTTRAAGATLKVIAAAAVLGATSLGALSRGAVAQAQPSGGVVVLWLASWDAAAALAVEVAPRGARVVPGAAPPGADAATRARAARGADTRAAGADVAVWIEREGAGSSVRAAAAGRELVAWAPLPEGAGEEDARIVALIAASVIDDLLAPAAPEAAPPLEVRLDVRARLAAPSPAAPALVASAAEHAAEAPLGVTGQRRDFFLELAATSAGIANGALLGAGLYPHRNVRLDLGVRLVHVIPSDTLAGSATLGGAFVTDDDDGRFEVGASAGLVFVTPLRADRCLDVHLIDGSTGSCATGPVFVGPVGGVFGGFSWGPFEAVRFGVRAHFQLAYLDAEVVPAGTVDLSLQVMP